MNITRRLYGSFAFIMLMLLLLIGVAGQNFSRMTEANRWNVHTYRVLGEIGAMTENLLSATRDARNFALTGDDNFRRLLLAAQSAYALHRSRAAFLTRDNPRQQQALQKLDEQEKQWRLELIAPLLAVRSGFQDAKSGDEAARGVALLAQRERFFDAPRVTLHAMQTEEQRLLLQRQADERARQQLAASTLATGAAFVLLLAGGLFVLFARGARQLSRANEQLEYEAEERSRIESRLRERQVFLNSLLDNIDAGVVACDASGTMTMLNRVTSSFNWMEKRTCPSRMFRCCAPCAANECAIRSTSSETAKAKNACSVPTRKP